MDFDSREHILASKLYTKIIPRLDYKAVYRKDKEGWRALGGISHFNTGWVVAHLEDQQILGYMAFRSKAQHVVIDIDCHTPESKKTLINRYFKVIQSIGTPSFVVKSSETGGIHIYYVFETLYHCEDLKASFEAKLGGVEAIDILTGKNNIRMPLGKGSCLLDPENPLLDYSHLSKYDQIDLLSQHSNIYEKIEDLIPLIKTMKSNANKHKELSVKSRNNPKLNINNDHPVLGFYAGNRLNTLIQLFNLSRSKEDFIKHCQTEGRKLEIYKSPSKDLICLSDRERLDHYTDFYDRFIKTKSKRKYVSKTPLVSSNFQPHEILRLKRYLIKIPEYKKLSAKGIDKKILQKQYLDFSIKIMNVIYGHYKCNRTQILELPSTYLKKLNTNYNVFWKVLKKHLFYVHKNYINSTVNYRCNSFVLERFINLLHDNILKVKELRISYLKTTYKKDIYKDISILDSYNNIDNKILDNTPLTDWVQNHYNILPELKSLVREKKEILEELGGFLRTERTEEGGFRKFWAVIQTE